MALCGRPRPCLADVESRSIIRLRTAGCMIQNTSVGRDHASALRGDERHNLIQRNGLMGCMFRPPVDRDHGQTGLRVQNTDRDDHATRAEGQRSASSRLVKRAVPVGGSDLGPGSGFHKARFCPLERERAMMSSLANVDECGPVRGMRNRPRTPQHRRTGLR